jgi:hypothetical protein
MVLSLQWHPQLHNVLSTEQLAYKKLLFFDAAEQLVKFMIDDWPSELRFKQVVENMIGWISFNLLTLIHPFLGFMKRNFIRLFLRATDLMRFTLQGFHWLSAARREPC